MNKEQGMMNTEVKLRHSVFHIPCSIFLQVIYSV
jgi:hypothetical protein